MEKELMDYIENLKKSTLDKKDLTNIKKSISKVKTILDNIFECSKRDIEEGDYTKEELLEEYLEEYKKSIEEPSYYQPFLTLLFSEYDTCKEIIYYYKKEPNKFNALMSLAKQKEQLNSTENIYHDINMENEALSIIRLAIRRIKTAKFFETGEINPSFKKEEILNSIISTKNQASLQIKKEIHSNLNRILSFLDEFGYIDESIEACNEILIKLGLSGLVNTKRNPLPAEEYDIQGNRINTEEFEDMGVLDFFKPENLKKLSPEELLVFDLIWRKMYFSARLEISEAFSAIEHLDLWYDLLEKDPSVIQDLDDQKLSIALKRDLALTYLIKNKKSIPPECEERYLKFLEENEMSQKSTTSEEIQKQTEVISGTMNIANDLVLAECIIVDKLLEGKLGAKNWGVLDEDEENVVFAVDLPNFRGSCLFSAQKDTFNLYLKEKNKQTKSKYPKYKGTIDDDYSLVTQTLLLPTSTYFKKYITQKYRENPSSHLYEQLATGFAGSKKIKHSDNKPLEGESK